MSLWPRFQQYFLRYDDLDFSIDISRMRFPDDFFGKMQARVEKAFAAMRELEAGAIANPDEQRMVGHYWLRDSKLAPTPELRADIDETNARIKQFAADVHSGKIAPQKGEPLQARPPDRHRRLGPRTAIHRRRARQRQRSAGYLLSSITRIRMDSIASSTGSAIISRTPWRW